jgi:predicted RNA-binding Zn-ribbon protein involved in translation (DUF1610 family)
MNMKEIFSSPNQAFFLLAKTHLESEGIEVEVTNDVLFVAVGCVPPDQCWPRLVIRDDSKEDIAKQKLSEFLEQNKNTSFPTFCPECDSEDIELSGNKSRIFYPKFKCNKCGHKWKNIGSY